MNFVRHYDAATARRGMLSHLRHIAGYPGLVLHNRYMVQNFLRRDLMGRFHGSFVGVYWLLLQPLSQFAVYYFVFGFLYGPRTGGGPDPYFAIYLFSGVIVFHSLVEATTHSCSIVVENGNLVKKVAFPSEVLVIHVATVSVVLYLVGAVVAFIVGMLCGVLSPGFLLLALPLVLAVQFVMTIGMGLLLSSLNVFIRDVAQLWRIVTMTWMFLSPVFWQPEMLLGKFGDTWFPYLILHLNPAYPLIQAHRLVLGIHSNPQVPGSDYYLGNLWVHLGVGSAWALGFLCLGYAVFMSRKHKFADLI